MRKYGERPFLVHSKHIIDAYNIQCVKCMHLIVWSFLVSTTKTTSKINVLYNYHWRLIQANSYAVNFLLTGWFIKFLLVLTWDYAHMFVDHCASIVGFCYRYHVCNYIMYVMFSVTIWLTLERSLVPIACVKFESQIIQRFSFGYVVTNL